MNQNQPSNDEVLVGIARGIEAMKKCQRQTGGTEWQSYIDTMSAHYRVLATPQTEKRHTRAEILEVGIRGMMKRAKEWGDEYTESYLEGCLESADILTGKVKTIPTALSEALVRAATVVCDHWDANCENREPVHLGMAHRLRELRAALETLRIHTTLRDTK